MPAEPAAAAEPRKPIRSAATGRAPMDRAKVASAVWWNWINSIVLAVLLTLVGMSLAYVIGWAIGVYLANDGAPEGKAPGLYWFSPMGLAAALLAALWAVYMTHRAITKGEEVLSRIVGAKEVSARQEPKLHEAAERVAKAAGIRKPRLVVIESKALNAFAAGRDELHATVGVTRGLIDSLEPHELDGVLAHELGHVLNRDVLYADVVALCVGLILILKEMAGATARVGADVATSRSSSSSSSSSKKDGGAGAAIVIAIVVLIVAAVLAPLMAQLVQMAISRQREYGADAAAAYLCGSPDGLAAALAKIDRCAEPMKVNAAVQHVFIVNPLRRFSESAGALMSTHPATSLRIARLKALAA